MYLELRSCEILKVVDFQALNNNITQLRSFLITIFLHDYKHYTATQLNFQKNKMILNNHFLYEEFLKF
jgi:hypothetical protein